MRESTKVLAAGALWVLALAATASILVFGGDTPTPRADVSLSTASCDPLRLEVEAGTVPRNWTWVVEGHAATASTGYKWPVEAGGTLTLNRTGAWAATQTQEVNHTTGCPPTSGP